MIKTIAVIGAGTMGRGIAQWFCQQNIKTLLIDVNQEMLKNSEKMILSSWDKLLTKGKFKAEEVDQFKSSLSIGNLSEVKEQDLVIEAIFENLEVKKELFKKLDEQLPKESLIASNTSSFPITELSSSVSEERRPHFLGLHFFNPAPIMKLVEIILGKETNSQLCHDLKKWFEHKGKEPALCKDSPGFIVNRLARNFYGESLRIAESDKEENFKKVDEVMRLVGGFRMGPFELMDLIGIDVNLDVTRSVWNAFSKNPRFAPHDLQVKLVEQGRFGKKTQKGFYSYE